MPSKNPRAAVAEGIADTRPHGHATSPRSSCVVERRLVDKQESAQYLGGISTDTVERLIHSGALPIVRLPVERAKNGQGRTGTSRRVLIDVRDLDALIDRSKETLG